MNTIEQEALQRYQTNLSLFSKQYPNLFKKLNLLDIAIQSGQYKEKYSLEYKDEGYFDVKELSTNQYLYNKNSNQFAKEFAKNITFDREKNTIQTFYENIYSKELADYFDAQDVCSSSHSATATIIDYTTSITQNKKIIKYIDKFIFLGVGLGTHIQVVDQKIDSFVYFIVEDDLELFRLSMFVVDYDKLAQKKVLFFSVAENIIHFQESFKFFLEHSIIFNHNLKYAIFSNHYKSKIIPMQSVIVTQSHLSYSYNRLLSKNIKTLNILDKDYNFLDVNLYKSETIFSQKPTLIIAAGPSLEKNLHWLKQNHKRFITIAVSATIKILEKSNIKPDIVVHIDEQDKSWDNFKNSITSFEFLKDSLFIFAPSIKKEMIEAFDKKDIFLIQHPKALYKKRLSSLQTPSVGEYNCMLALILGAKEVYLLGLDLSVDSKSGKTHSSDHHNNSLLDLSKSNNLEENTTLTNKTLKVKGNFKPFVYTTPVFNMSIHIMHSIGESLKYHNTKKIYNLNDGAYFNNTIPTKIDDIDLKKYPFFNKKTVLNQIQNFLQNNSSTTLTDEDIKALHDRIQDANYKKKQIEIFSAKKFNSVETYINEHLEFIKNLTNSSNELSHIFDFYFKYTSHYIVDMLNTKNLKNQKHHIKKINKLLIKQLNKILNRYIDALDAILKEYETVNAVS